MSTTLFRNRTSNLGLITQNVQWLLLIGTAFVVSAYLQVVRGYNAIQTGVIFTAATGGILQIARHVLSQRDPDATTRKELRGAMFHQLEEEAGWRYASGLLGYP